MEDRYISLPSIGTTRGRWTVRVCRIVVIALSLTTFAAGAFAQQPASEACSAAATASLKSEKQLPPQPRPFGGVIKRNALDSKPCWEPQVVPPKGAPNILLIITDDVGFGAPSTFGGVIPTPTLDRLASTGLRYTQFHTTALCSPTRAALITGHNHHSVGFGVIGEMATGYPGYDSVITKDKTTIGQILKENGYLTSWFGKNHNTPSYQSSQAGPFDQWPIGMGFEYFYGFVGGETDQWHPDLYRNTTRVYPYLGKPNYNLTTDMADDAIDYLNQMNELAPQKPFFMYYAPGGTHAPHHPTQEWVDKFKGKFNMGWNNLREVIFANQKKLGVIPQDAQLTPWPDDLLKRWDALSPDEKKLFERQMEVYAAYLSYTDFEVGRVVKAVEDMGKLDNTLIIYISGDNGGSAEGSPAGTPNEMTFHNGLEVPTDVQLKKYYDIWGTEKTSPHMAVGWTWAMDTPFKWTKQVASYFGGTRNGMVIAWPGHIKDVGGVRNQFHHVIDIVPTILEATGIPSPETVNGIAQKPIEGVSMAYTFDQANATAPSKRDTQYFEMVGNRAIYHDGWIASTTPPAPPWELGTTAMPPIDQYKWELYNITEDYSENNNLAGQNPDKLKELQALFLTEAAKYQVFPLDNSGFVRLLAPKPSAIAGRTDFTYTGVNVGIPVGNAPSILDRDYTITANITVPDGGAEGVIATLGGRFGGYALLLSHSFNWWLKSDLFKKIGLVLLILGVLLIWLGKNGKWKARFGRALLLIAALGLVAVFATDMFGIGRGRPIFVYNFLDLERFRWEGLSGLSAGKHTIVFDFKYDGPGPAKGGTGVLTVDGKEVARKTIPHTIPLLMPPDESFDVGLDTRSPVDFTYEVPFAFTGTIDQLNYKLGPSQMTAEEQKKAAEFLAAAKD